MDKKALEQTDGVLSVMEVAGQTQVVLGSQVQYIYEELLNIFPQNGAKSEKKDISNEKKVPWELRLKLFPACLHH